MKKQYEEAMKARARTLPGHGAWRRRGKIGAIAHSLRFGSLSQDPTVASRMQQMQEAMQNPQVQQQVTMMQQMMQNQGLMQRMQELRNDPDMAPFFEEIRKASPERLSGRGRGKKKGNGETRRLFRNAKHASLFLHFFLMQGGMAAMMKFYNDPAFLQKLGEKLSDVLPASAAAAGAAPAAAQAPAAAEVEVTDLLSAARVGDLEAVEVRAIGCPSPAPLDNHSCCPLLTAATAGLPRGRQVSQCGRPRGPDASTLCRRRQPHRHHQRTGRGRGQPRGQRLVGAE